MKFLELGKYKQDRSYSVGVVSEAGRPLSFYCSDSLRQLLCKWLALLSGGAALVAAVGGLLFLLLKRKKG